MLAGDNFNRGERAKGFDLFIQLHSDAAINNPQIDHAVIYHPMDGRNYTENLGESLAGAIRTTMGLVGISSVRTRVNNDGEEWFAVMRGAMSVDCPRYFIAENGFHTNPRSAHWLMQSINLQRLAKAYTEVISNLFS